MTEHPMKTRHKSISLPARVHPRMRNLRARAGKARYALLLWLLGIPLPIILLIWLVKGCV